MLMISLYYQKEIIPREIKINMQQYLDSLRRWCDLWKLKLNNGKCYQHTFTKKRNINDILLRINNRIIRTVTQKRILGVTFDSPKLNFNIHINNLCTNIKKRLNILGVLSSTTWGSSRDTLRRIYIAFIRSKIEYGAVILEKLSDKNMNKLEVLQNRGLRSILGAWKTSPILSLQVEAYIPPLKLYFKYLNAKNYIRLLHRPENDYVAKLIIDNNNSIMKEEVINHLSAMKIEAIQRVPTDLLSPAPPWIDMSQFVHLDIENRDPYINIRALVDNLLLSSFPNYTQIYTDRSKLENGSAGAAIYIPELEISTNWMINRNHTIIGAELFAIEKALEISLAAVQHH